MLLLEDVFCAKFDSSRSPYNQVRWLKWPFSAILALKVHFWVNTDKFRDVMETRNLVYTWLVHPSVSMPNFTSMLQFLYDPRSKMFKKSWFCSILQYFAALFSLVSLWLWAWNFGQSCSYSRRFFLPNLTAVGVLMTELDDWNGLFQWFWC